MKRNLFFIAGLLFSLNAVAQTPGGVKDSLRAWLKANTGITPTPLNTVTLWNEVSGAGMTGDFVTNPVFGTQLPPSYAPAGINFNPHVVFDKNLPNSLASTNFFQGNSLFDPTSNNILQVIKIHSFAGTGVWMKWQNANSGTPRLGFEMNNGSNLGQLRFDFPTTNYSPTNVNDKYVLADFFTAGGQKGLYLSGAQNFSVATAANPATCFGKLSIGNEPPVGVPSCTTPQSVDPYPTTLDVAEVIFFKRALSVAERNRVESYLAIKYGFTLDQTITTNNYTSSRGNIIWNRAANVPFLNNITGIGRDDSSALIQRQSKSINVPVGMVTVYNGIYNGGNAPLTNVTNTNNFTADTSFAVFGDNNLGLTFTRCFAGTTPGTSSLRIARVWKTQRTGTIGTITLAIAASSLPATVRNLIVSTDSAFTSGTTTIYPLTNTAGILTASITLPGANSFFTYAGDSLKATPTANSPLCEGSNLQLSSNLAGGTYSWTGPANFSSSLANPVVTGVSPANSGYYVLNGTISGCPIRPDSVQVVVSIKPPPPTVVTPLIYCAGDVAAPLTAGSVPGNTLHWYATPVGGNGTTTPPIPNTAYEDTLTYWVTQDNNGCESIRTKQDIQIRYKPNGIILGTQASICQGAVDTFEYFGNPRGNAIYDFKTPTTASTLLSGSGPGPYYVRFDSAGVYRVRMQVNNFGCVGDESFFTVTVRPSPAAYATSKEDVCVDEVVNIALYNTASMVTRYDYDWDNGTIVYSTATGGPYGIAWSTPGLKVIKLVATTVGCPSRTTYDSITVHDYPDARIAFVSSKSICAGDSELLRASETDSNTHFIWTPNYFFNSGNTYEAWGVVKQGGYISLKATSKYGCVASDSTLITAQRCCEMFFPNAFTPNGDGKNDVFRVVTRGHHEIATFRVLNRWGQTIFETKDELHGWDGTYNGRDQDAGTYYYYIKYKCRQNDMLEEKGEVILLR